MPAEPTIRAFFNQVTNTVTYLVADAGNGRAEGEPPEEAAACLAWHAVHAHVEHRDVPENGDVAESLAAYCKSTKPAYCVLGAFGAYGYGRMRETLFGGVTRHMLQQSPVPLIIAH